MDKLGRLRPADDHADAAKRLQEAWARLVEQGQRFSLGDAKPSLVDQLQDHVTDHFRAVWDNSIPQRGSLLGG